MFTGTDDDDLFNPAASSKLAALFDSSLSPKKSSNETLTYTAPRQPKSALSDLPKPKTQSSVLCAKAVGLYKSIDGKYSFQGKYGLALIGTDKLYEIIIYKDKQNILTRAKIQPTFSYTLLRDNFASLFDDQNQNWSVLFDNAKDYTEFYTELEKRNVKIVENFTKTDNRELEGAKLAEEQGAGGEAQPATIEKYDKKIDDEQSDSSEAQMKANILSRMAKMGQAILPAVPTQSDSDSDLSNTARSSRKPKRTEKLPVSENKPEYSKPKELPVTSSFSHNFPDLTAQIVPLSHQSNQITLNHNASPVIDPFNLLLAENRTHNCEIRMNLSQISNKMDTVLQRIEQNEVKVAEENLLKTKLKAMELKVANLTKELEESVNTNIELQRKLLERNGDVLKEKDDKRRIDDLEKQLVEKESYIKRLEEDNNISKDYKSFIIDTSTNFDRLNEICEKYADCGDVIEDFRKSLNRKLDEVKNEQNSDNEELKEKANKFFAKINAVMQDFEQYIEKHIDSSNNTVTPDFTSKSLPRSIRSVTNYLVKEFEREFKISYDNSSEFQPQALSDFND